MKNEPAVLISPWVTAAIASGRPVVGLESTVYSTLGLLLATWRSLWPNG